MYAKMPWAKVIKISPFLVEDLLQNYDQTGRGRQGGKGGPCRRDNLIIRWNLKLHCQYVASTSWYFLGVV